MIRAWGNAYKKHLEQYACGGSTAAVFSTLTSGALAAPALLRPALAAGWPADKPIRAVVPFSAGSTIDVLGRVVLDAVSQSIGQTISSKTAVARVARSALRRSQMPNPTATRC